MMIFVRIFVSWTNENEECVLVEPKWLQFRALDNGVSRWSSEVSPRCRCIVLVFFNRLKWQAIMWNFNKPLLRKTSSTNLKVIEIYVMRIFPTGQERPSMKREVGNPYQGLWLTWEGEGEWMSEEEYRRTEHDFFFQPILFTNWLLKVKDEYYCCCELT